MIGKLQFDVHSKPDISLSVGIVARFSANPRQNHLMAVKRILRYLKGTINFGLYYEKNTMLDLKVYTDVDWAKNVDDRKTTCGEIFLLGRRLVSWTSKKQNCISQSTSEAEYVATAINCTNLVWHKQMLKGMKEEITEPIVMYCDNTSAINISKNPVMHPKTKHSAIKYHYLREPVQTKEVKMEYVNTKEQLANIFTKVLPKESHEYFRGKLVAIPLSQANSGNQRGALHQPSRLSYFTFDAVDVALGLS
jgi:hypothetical protein